MRWRWCKKWQLYSHCKEHLGQGSYLLQLCVRWLWRHLSPQTHVCGWKIATGSKPNLLRKSEWGKLEETLTCPQAKSITPQRFDWCRSEADSRSCIGQLPLWLCVNMWMLSSVRPKSWLEEMFKEGKSMKGGWPNTLWTWRPCSSKSITL